MLVRPRCCCRECPWVLRLALLSRVGLLIASDTADCFDEGFPQTLTIISDVSLLSIIATPNLIIRGTNVPAACHTRPGPNVFLQRIVHHPHRHHQHTETLDFQAATSLVFLPSIPSWLPLWSLLSPEDAISGGGGGGGSGGKAAGSRSGRAAPPVATGQVAGAETKSPEGLDAVRAGDGSGGDDHCSIDGGNGCRLAAAGADDGGRGAVRLVQTVAAAQTPYRYAAVLHFWDVVRHGEERERGASWW